MNGGEPGLQQLLKHGDKIEVLSTLPMVGTHLPSPVGQVGARLTHSFGSLALDQYSPRRLHHQTAALRN